MHVYIELKSKVHRLIPSKFPPKSLFDWAQSPEELIEIAALEGLTNDRLAAEYGQINRVDREDWVGGEGSSPLMSAFTHIGYPSRFSDGNFGVYYAADSLTAAVQETIFHRERFYSASNEPPCTISMREYIARVKKPLINISDKLNLLNPDPNRYQASQEFARQVRQEKEWGIYYPSLRKENATCIAILRPPALTIPIQGCHLKYSWNGNKIHEIRKENVLRRLHTLPSSPT